MIDVALASCVELPEPDFDEAPLAAALGDAGLSWRVMGWDDPQADWTAARMTLLRATWNYPLAPDAFLAWAEATSEVSALWNPLAAVRWNLHKGYLLELERAGVAVAPTELVPRAAERRLAAVLAERGWDEVVIKPAVSAASYRTLRAGSESLETGETHLSELAAHGDVLVQRYLPSVETYGERALIWIDGGLTHAVRKSPRFDGQDESISEAEIAPAEAALAESAMAHVAGGLGEPLMYGRIDLAPGPDGAPVVMELELIEPSLFFDRSASALELFVAAVRRELGRPGGRSAAGA